MSLEASLFKVCIFAIELHVEGKIEVCVLNICGFVLGSFFFLLKLPTVKKNLLELTHFRRVRSFKLGLLTGRRGEGRKGGENPFLRV